MTRSRREGWAERDNSKHSGPFCGTEETTIQRHISQRRSKRQLPKHIPVQRFLCKNTTGGRRGETRAWMLAPISSQQAGREASGAESVSSRSTQETQQIKPASSSNEHLQQGHAESLWCNKPH